MSLLMQAWSPSSADGDGTGSELASPMARGKGTQGGLEVVGWHGQQEGALQPAADANQETMGRNLRGLDDDRRCLRCQATQIRFSWKREMV